MSAPEHMVPLRSIHNPAMVVKQIKSREGNSIMLSLLWNFSVKCPYFHTARYKPTCSPSC
jgi:hypothetical protein